MRVILYHTMGCHLCEQAEAVIAGFQVAFPQRSIQILKTDIADSEELVCLYGIRIPVLKIEGQSQTLDWPFDINELHNYLAQN